MARRRNISRQTRSTLWALLNWPEEWQYGYNLMEKTGLASGTLYPMLMRLCDQGYLETKWIASPLAGRPPRHAYRLTASGRQLAHDASREIEGPDKAVGDFAV